MPDRSPSAAPRPAELRLCGLSAVRARFAKDPGSVLRLYFDYRTGREIGALCKTLAAARKIYRCVEPAELEKVAGSVHHGGIVAVVAAGEPGRVAPADPVRWAAQREALLVLERIGNAHNLGAIARTAAFFGVPRIVLSGDAASARPSDAAYRVAEGGLEFVEVLTVLDLPAFLRALAAAGYAVLGTSPRGGALGPAPGRRGPAGPLAVVLGNEEAGLSPEALAACTRLVTLAGTGHIESLNVSACAAILIHHLGMGQRARSGSAEP